MAKNPGIKLLSYIQDRFPEIAEVKDAKRGRKMTFAVDSKDCEFARPEKPCHCAVAISLARQTGLYAMVRRTIIVLIDTKKKKAERWMTDKPLASAILTFDASAKKFRETGVGGAIFQPGVYTMRAPGPRQSLDRRPPAPTKKHGSHPHKGMQAPLRNTWGDPTPRLAPVMSRMAL